MKEKSTKEVFQMRERRQPFFIFSLFFAISGGLAAYFAAPPNNFWPLSFLAISFFGIITLINRPLRAAICGLIWAFTYFFALFDWASISAGTPVAQIALALVLSLFFFPLAAIWSALFSSLRTVKRNVSQQKITYWRIFLQIILASFIWIGIEIFRASFPLGGMPWGNFAFSLTDSPLLRLARYGGTHLVQFFALIIGLSLTFSLYLLWKRKVFIASFLFFTATLILILPFGIPNLKLGETHLTALIVQGNVPNSTKSFSGGERALQITKNHTKATKENFKQHIDLVIWPESASDRDIRKDAESNAQLQEITNLIGTTPILLGTQEYFADNTRTNDYVVSINGKIAGKYSKQHPVPFGEYVPWRETIGKYFTEIDQITTDMIPGKNVARLEIKLKKPIKTGENSVKNKIVVGTPICFEVAFDEIVTKAATNTDFLIFPTNNSSFQRSGQAAQQFAMAKFRAFEHGKTVIQVSTSGISGIINANGVVAYQSNLFTSDTRVMPVELREYQSFAAHTYQQRIFVFSALAIFASIVAVLKYLQTFWVKAKNNSAS